MKRLLLFSSLLIAPISYPRAIGSGVDRRPAILLAPSLVPNGDQAEIYHFLLDGFQDTEHQPVQPESKDLYEIEVGVAVVFFCRHTVKV